MGQLGRLTMGLAVGQHRDLPRQTDRWGNAMQFGYTMSPDRGGNDRLLANLADLLEAEGLRLAGLVQENRPRPDEAPCDMLTRVLPNGPTLQISQSLGRHARGCRLDPTALEEAVGLVQQGIAVDEIDLLIVNKFGKHEADGRGMRGLIGECVSLGIPVVVGVNPLNASAFEDFAHGSAELIPPKLEALHAWVRSAVANRSVAI